MTKLLNTVSIISIAFLIWLGASWLDVIADNTRPDPQHSDLNIFVMISEVGKQ